MKRFSRFALLGGLLGVLLGLPGLAAQVLFPFSASWFGALDTVAILLVFLPVALAVAFLVSLVGLAFRKTRRSAVCGIALSAAAIAAFTVSMRISGRVRLRAFSSLAERSQPLVDALHRFEADRGEPASALADLVPVPLSEVPRTGIDAYPEYVYLSGSEAQTQFGSRWALYVPCSLGFLNWDIFYYVPDEQYPDRGHGGSIERIRNWAYVHE